MGKTRLDQLLVDRNLVETRSKGREYIQSGLVAVDGIKRTKPGWQVDSLVEVEVAESEPYVSRAGSKLEAANEKFKLDFKGKTVLDVGSSTGGFSDYALRGGAKQVIAVDVGTKQMHERLRRDPRLNIYEQTDIRDFKSSYKADIALIDVSFISLRKVLIPVSGIVGKEGFIIALCKPQFEAGADAKHRGVIKNDKIRRAIFKDFEKWLGDNNLHQVDKFDSTVHGSKGNQERFYLIRV